MEKILERINEVRNGKSVNSLAKSMGMAQTTLNSYLSGDRKPSIELIKRICANFRVSADWLLGLTDDQSGAKAAGEGPPPAADERKITTLEAENAALKGEIRGLRFALDAALKGAQPAPASASRSRPA